MIMVNMFYIFIVIAVIVFHLDPKFLPGGFLGVDVFFVISGFLIYRIIDNDLRNGSFSLGRFIQRRVHRLLPAMLVMTATSILMAAIFLPLSACLKVLPSLTKLSRHQPASDLFDFFAISLEHAHSDRLGGAGGTRLWEPAS